MSTKIMEKFKFYKFIKFSSIWLLILGFILLYKIVPYRLAWNYTNSENIGLYLLSFENHVVDYKLGDLVILCIPNNSYSDIALQRKYLTKGSCPYNTSYEIKQIIATYPTQIKISYNQIFINKYTLNILSHDSKGRPLNSILKPQNIPRGSYFVLGKTNKSFDSRYYGLVPESFIKGLAYPIFTKKTL